MPAGRRLGERSAPLVSEKGVALIRLGPFLPFGELGATEASRENVGSAPTCELSLKDSTLTNPVRTLQRELESAATGGVLSGRPWSWWQLLA